MKDDVWLKKACLKDKDLLEKHPEMAAPCAGWATDGCRAHRIKGAVPVDTHQTWKNTFLYFSKRAEGPIVVEVTTEPLVEAIRLGRVFNNDIALEFGETLAVGCKNAETGEVRTDLADGEPPYINIPKDCPRFAAEPKMVYRKTGPNVLCRFSGKYLLDALAGMGKVTKLVLNEDAPSHVMFLTSDNGREALVMGLNSNMTIPDFKDEPDPVQPPPADGGMVAEVIHSYHPDDPGDGTTNPDACVPEVVA